jgi:hypothetical protein
LGVDSLTGATIIECRNTEGIREKLARTARSVKKKVVGKLSRLSHRALPSDLLKKATDKLRAERSLESKVFLVMSLQKMVREPKHPKETGVRCARFAGALLVAQEVLLGCAGTLLEIKHIMHVIRLAHLLGLSFSPFSHYYFYSWLTSTLVKVGFRMALLGAWDVAVGGVEAQLLTPGMAWRESHSYLGIYYDTIISVMVHDEVQFSNMGNDEEGAQLAAGLHLRTHDLVAAALGMFVMKDGFLIDAKEHESIILFCAKALAINYFCVPRMAHVICSAVSKATPIVGRRSKAMGVSMRKSTAIARAAVLPYMPTETKAVVGYFTWVCQVDGAPTDVVPCEAGPAVEAGWNHHREAKRMADLADALCGPWSQCFVTDSSAGFGFFSIFMEVLFRRSITLFAFTCLETERDVQLGTNERSVNGTMFVPGFCELQTCFLRQSLLTEHALKRAFRIGAGPPSIVCNWTDRTAACALTLSQNGVFFSSLLRDLMLQTSTTHVADVMALLGSLKALFESFHHMHGSVLPHELDHALIDRFISQLLSCPHYVVTMFALRWIYDCIDYFCPEIRVLIMNRMLEPECMGKLFCHWEPTVRNLMHMLIIYRLYVVVIALSMEAGLARGVVEECDVISVATGFMVGSRSGSREREREA